MTFSLEFLLIPGSSPKSVERFTASAAGATVTLVGRDTLAADVNAAIAASVADYVCVVDSDGVLPKDALARLSSFAAGHPDATVLFSDEAVRQRGKRHPRIVAKPIFSPERLRCQFYFGDLVVYSRALVEELGGLDAGLPGAELYDLALRASLVSSSIEHIDSPLFVRPEPRVTALGTVALESTRRALEAHLAASGGGTVVSVGADGVHHTRRPVFGEPLVSIVIPSRGVHSVIDGVSTCYVLDAVRGIMDKSTYRNFEIVVVLDSVAEPEVVEELRLIAGDKFVKVDWTKPFNFSDKINLGAIHARGDFILLLNDDVDLITPGWLEAMLALAQRPNAGMVGAMLYFGDETIQHAGHGYWENDASHIGLDAPHNDPGPLDGHRVEREVSGVTAACAMMPTAVFHEVGGLTNLLPGNFNDVDLCMKTTWLGYDIYWTPHAELYHFESKTRDASVHSFEVEIAWGRWSFRMHDPRYWPYPHNRPPA